MGDSVGPWKRTELTPGGKDRISQVGAWDNFISSPLARGFEFLDFMILLLLFFFFFFCTISEREARVHLCYGRSTKLNTLVWPV